MDGTLQQKIDRYAENSFKAQQYRIVQESDQGMKALPVLGQGNAAYSRYADPRHAHLHAQRINDLVLAKANSFMDAYEIYGAPLDDRILALTTQFKNEAMAGMVAGAKGELSLEVMRINRNQQQATMIGEEFGRQIMRDTNHILADVSCQIEQRKINPKFKKKESISAVSEPSASRNQSMIQYDPFGPILAVLQGMNRSETFMRMLNFAGINIEWPQLGERDNASHSTRIRAFMSAVQAAYSALDPDARGVCAQAVAKQVMADSAVSDTAKAQLKDSLNMIGWDITPEGLLITNDALTSERFLPMGSQFDAYITIKSIYEKATKGIMILDGYVGSVLFKTIRTVVQNISLLRVLTISSKLDADFQVEAAAFNRQFPHIRVEVRSGRDFHDRFIVVDEADYYHIGASIKDAGSRAFLISRLEDQAVIDLLKRHIDESWNNATVFLNHP